MQPIRRLEQRWPAAWRHQPRHRSGA